MSNELISLTVDGIEVQVPAGSTVLQACESIGVEIPTLCTDPRLDPYGACRMCVVEIQPGPPRPMASCTMQAAPGMTVVTNSRAIKDIRKHVIELQLQHHPLDCPYCDQAGTCELQDETFAQEIHQSPYETIPKAHPEEILNEVILINHNRCILCGRCVRMCDEQIGVYALDFVHRAIGTFIAPAQHKEMDCERCGMCIETCPVGALLSRPFKHAARSWQTDKTASTCPHCSVGCSLLVESRHGDVVRTRTNGLEEPANGILCAKGFFGHSFVNSGDRLTQPLIRRDGRLQPATWHEAISHVSSRLRGVVDRHGPSAVGAVGSPNCTNEDNYALQRFMRQVIGSNNVYSQASGFHETFHALASVLGSGALLRTQNELLESDVILVVGADIGQTHNVVGAHIKRAVRRDGRQLLMATRLASTLDRYAAETVRVRPGGEAALLAALAGHDDVSEDATGVSEAALGAMRRLLDAAGSVAVVWDTGVWTLGRASQVARAAASLAQAHADVRLFPLAERANTVGTLLAGMAPDTLPGLRPVADAAARAEVEAVTGAPALEESGASLSELLEGGGRALYVMGEDLVSSAGDPDAMRENLANLELLIVQDIFMSPTAELADVVLPGASFAEKGGHFTNFEGRRGPLAPAIIPVGDARPDWEIIARLAAALGNDFGWRSHEPISQEIERLWRMPDIEGGEPVGDFNGALAPAINGGTFTLSTEQHLYTAGVAGRRAPSLALMLPDAVAELNPEDAKNLNVTDGDAISLASHAGALNLKTLVASRVPRGVVNLPDRFLEAPPRRLDSAAPNGIPVQVTKR